MTIGQCFISASHGDPVNYKKKYTALKRKLKLLVYVRIMYLQDDISHSRLHAYKIQITPLTSFNVPANDNILRLFKIHCVQHKCHVATCLDQIGILNALTTNRKPYMWWNQTLMSDSNNLCINTLMLPSKLEIRTSRS